MNEKLFIGEYNANGNIWHNAFAHLLADYQIQIPNDFNMPDFCRVGFSECWRVLEDYGVLIFKWNESEISVKKVEKLFSQKALFCHPSGTKSKTHWLCFMKIPLNVNKKEDELSPTSKEVGNIKNGRY